MDALLRTFEELLVYIENGNIDLINSPEYNTAKEELAKYQSEKVQPAGQVDKVVELYNSICTNLPKVTKVTDKRKKLIKSLSKHFSLEEIEEAFSIANDNDFLSGKTTNWKANFDWLCAWQNMLKVREGNYGGAGIGGQADQYTRAFGG